MFESEDEDLEDPEENKDGVCSRSQLSAR